MTKAHSITDVAQAAGVSPTTVSHALSGKRAVSATTRQRIYEAIDRLDYRPNLVAKSLRNQKTNSVALLVADIANPYYPAVARAVHDGLNSEGYVSIIGNTDGEAEAERTFLREMVSRGVDGIIMQPAALSVPDIRAIVGRALPLVLIAHERGTLLSDQVGTDDCRGITEAVRHLVHRGLGDIAFVSGREVEPLATARLATPGIVRLAAVHRAARACGATVRDEWVEHAPYTRDGGFAAGARLLAGDPRPRVVMCANDLMAFGVIDAARQAGLGVPEDVAVVGFDDVDTANLITPRLTTIVNPAALVGAACAATLLRRIAAGPDAPYERQLIPTHLVVRESA